MITGWVLKVMFAMNKWIVNACLLVLRLILFLWLFHFRMCYERVDGDGLLCVVVRRLVFCGGCGRSGCKGRGAEFVILECVPSVKKMFFHAKQALHTSHITRTQFHYLITRNLCVYFLKIN